MIARARHAHARDGVHSMTSSPAEVRSYHQSCKGLRMNRERGRGLRVRHRQEYNILEYNTKPYNPRAPERAPNRGFGAGKSKLAFAPAPGPDARPHLQTTHEAALEPQKEMLGVVAFFGLVCTRRDLHKGRVPCCDGPFQWGFNRVYMRACLVLCTRVLGLVTSDVRYAGYSGRLGS